MAGRGGLLLFTCCYILFVYNCNMESLSVDNIVPRSEWGARPARRETLLKSAAKNVIIHHTATRTCKSLAEVVEDLQAIQRTHMNDQHLDDIGYNFLVTQDGTVYQGRGWNVVGAHTKGHNEDSVGIAFMGNFDVDSPSAEALMSVKELINFGVSEGHVLPDYVLSGHREVEKNVECPGTKLLAALSKLRATE